jgi:H+/Cl- antiporter ClcA/predicted transcriptional regulator
MTDHVRQVEESSTTGGLPVAPSMGPALIAAEVPARASLVDRRIVAISGICIVLAMVAAVVARLLIHVIAFVTHLAFYQRASFDVATASPAGAVERLGLWVIPIPVIGGIIVGLMARYGSKAIRGHGIPEAMEQVLLNESRIPARITFLKPLSAAVAIGTGGPFGAEGPIIATGGALGSLVGQLMPTTAVERKTLLAAGAAAGMSATFGAPVSAVLLAVELLLFEFRPRSLIPVALASATAASVRIVFEGTVPMFPMLGNMATPTGLALACYIVMGVLFGLAAVLVTKAVYWVEDAFEHLPVHWMWWPAIGGIAVGVVGYFAPRTLGVGYTNISDFISQPHVPGMTVRLVTYLFVMKFVSWVISLGSGTSGGTLAPLFTIGGGLGAVLGIAAQRLFPAAEINPGLAALVGMAAIFAGASRALLASVVFAFETTLQPLGLLPLLGGCSASFLVSCLLMPNTIMTEKIARRGVRVPSEYAADFLDQVLVRDMMSKDLVSLPADDTLDKVRAWLTSGGARASHQGFPVVDRQGSLVGVVTRRDLLDPDRPASTTVATLIRRPPVIVYSDLTLRDAADHMVNHDIGRLPVLERGTYPKLVGMITRSDLLKAHRRRLSETQKPAATLRPWRRDPAQGKKVPG